MRTFAMLVSISLCSLTPATASNLYPASTRDLPNSTPGNELSVGAPLDGVQSAPMSPMRLADNSGDEGACVVVYGGTRQCYDSYRWLCTAAKYTPATATFYAFQKCADLGE